MRGGERVKGKREREREISGIDKRRGAREREF